MADIKPEEVRALRPGWKTTEFYVSLGGAVLPWLVQELPPAWRAALGTGAAAVYALARGLAKLGIGK
jgi:hypothetical protein